MTDVSAPIRCGADWSGEDIGAPVKNRVDWSGEEVVTPFGNRNMEDISLRLASGKDFMVTGTKILTIMVLYS